MKPYRKFGNLFQIRWKEKLGLPESPYLYRWTLVLFGYTIRLHHWIKSDDCRFYHDHSGDFISIVLKGQYWNVVPTEFCGFGEQEPNRIHRASDLKGKKTIIFRDCHYNYVEGIFNSWDTFKHMFQSIWKSKTTTRHWLCIPQEGAWTIILCGRPYKKWGFYVNNHMWRPLRYFHKYGIIQTPEYQ